MVKGAKSIAAVPLLCARATRLLGCGSLLVVLWALPSRSSAQTIRGRVLDATSGEPVVLAFVGLMVEGRQMVVSALGGTDGTFEVTAPEPGSYYIYVNRTGYSTLMDGAFELGDDGMLDVQIGLKPTAIELEPLLVESESDATPLERVGFYDRAALGQGSFFTREEIRLTAIDKVTDAIRNVPRFEVMRSRPVIGLEAELNPEVRVLRGGEYCSPTLYVDGTPVAFGGRGGRARTPVRPDDYVTPGDVEAIEVYTRISQIPLGYEAIGGCGILLIWTRFR